MSKAGTKSTQGDIYQLELALYWLTQLLSDDDIAFVQAESNGVVGEPHEVSVDDIVIKKVDGQTIYIQAKKNQPKYRRWKQSDIAGELDKAYNQLVADPDGVVEFWSGTPFGEFEALLSEVKESPDYFAFTRTASKSVVLEFEELRSRWGCDEEFAFSMLARLAVGEHHNVGGLRTLNLTLLGARFARPEQAHDALISLLLDHQGKLNVTSRFTVTREMMITHLEHRGIIAVPSVAIDDAIRAIRRFSRVYRPKIKATIAGRHIDREELGQLISFVEKGAKESIVVDKPGSGKTCLLFDLVDHFEADEKYCVLFFKGDRFTNVDKEIDLISAGLGEDAVSLCALVSTERRVVVVIDSLDVLSLEREHAALNLFLRMIDRLVTIDNVSVVAACRSFDIKYDAYLRQRDWKNKIVLRDLDYSSVVEPLIGSLGFNASAMSADLKALLCVPQNLRLLEALDPESITGVSTAADLQQTFIEEVVVKSPLMGNAVMRHLEEFAERQVDRRAQYLPAAAYPGDENSLRALVSAGVLSMDRGQVGFAHQTLLDVVLVRSAIRKDISLSQFIAARPQLPFLRPAVRSFFYHLRSNRQLFEKWVWGALSSDGVAYHFKRLIVESFAELRPDSEDWPLLRRIFHEDPHLFDRLLGKAGGPEWFDILVSLWMPALRSHDADIWQRKLSLVADRWIKDRPAEVIALWLNEINQSEGHTDSAAWAISVSIEKLEDWSVDGVRELVVALLESIRQSGTTSTSLLSRYVDESDDLEDRLWEEVTRDVSTTGEDRHKLGDLLHCSPHDFYREKFLEDRLKKSERFLEIVYSSVENWASQIGERYQSLGLKIGFLSDTNWRLDHNKSDHYHVDSLNFLLNALHATFEHYSRTGSKIWQEYRERMRASRDEGLLAILIEACRANCAFNADLIGDLLCDEELINSSNLQYELSRLATDAYPYIAKGQQAEHQRLLLQRYLELALERPEREYWVCEWTVGVLSAIPCIFRIPDAQEFIDRNSFRTDSTRPQATIHGWSGTVGSPVSTAQLLSLTDRGLERLLRYYLGAREFSSHPADIHVGGKDMVEATLSEAACRDPERYFNVLSRLDDQLYDAYADSILRGVGDHLRYRFSRVQPPQGWGALHQPPGDTLARRLIRQIELRDPLKIPSGTLTSCIDGISSASESEEVRMQVVMLLFRLKNHPDPREGHRVICYGPEHDESARDIRTESINCVRGVSAESAIDLLNRYLEEGQEPPELLLAALTQFSRDPEISVRAALLDHLPYLTWKQIEWGWRLFNNVFVEPQTSLWILSERHLYHQYHREFSRVWPYLERIREEAVAIAGDVWARITTLAYLSEYVSEEELFQTIEVENLVSLWEGAVQVFTANLKSEECRTRCVAGIERVIQNKAVPKIAKSGISRLFSRDDGKNLPTSILKGYISLDSDDVDLKYYYLFDWLEGLSNRDPIEALEIAEVIAERLSREQPRYVTNTKPLLSALTGILREADKRDDVTLIRRAIALQDAFLRLNLHGMESLFEDSAIA